MGRAVTALVVFSCLLLVLVIPVGATTAIYYESGMGLITCSAFDCFTTQAQGVSATINVGSETVTNDGLQATAEWVGVDVFSMSHYWVQVGWAVGALPNGVFTSTPILYAEYQFSGYQFTNCGSTAFGTSHSFQIWYTGSDNHWHLSIDGTVCVTVSPSPLSIQYGQASAFLEDHENPAGTGLVNPTDNGHWWSLQFYWGTSWYAWGANDPNSPVFPEGTSGIVAGTCGAYIPNKSSNAEFTVTGGASATYACSEGGRLSSAHPDELLPNALPLLGPSGNGIQGGAPQVPTTYNWRNIVIALSPIGFISGFFVWRRFKRRKRIKPLTHPKHGDVFRLR